MISILYEGLGTFAESSMLWKALTVAEGLLEGAAFLWLTYLPSDGPATLGSRIVALEHRVLKIIEG